MAIDNKIQGNRLQFVDISKGISITVIVMLHISSSIFPEAVRSLVGSYWHVPVFFIIAGFFIKEDKLLAPKQFIINKVKTLYLPATYIYLLVVLCHNLFVMIGWYPLGEFHPANKIPYEMWSLGDYAINIIKTIFCAGQEQIMGAMWFLYTLLFAICFISLLSFCLRRVIHDKMKYEWTRAIVLFVLQIINVISFNKYSISIPRVSNLFTFSFLIYLGMLMFQKKKIKFNNTWFALICFLVLLQACFLRKESGVLYNPGACVDVLQYDVVCICALYVVAYVSLLLSNIKWGGG